MRTENLLNKRIFVFKSLRVYYGWLNTVKNVLLHTKNVSFKNKVWCLSHGFSPNFLKVIGEKELKSNYKNYLSNKEYYKLHPFNDQYSFWIDDKLTTKYVFSKHNEYLPKYYFQTDDKDVLRLSDCEKDYECSAKGIMECLDDVKLLAAKRMIGSCGHGFYRLEKKDDGYYISNKKASREEVEKLISGLKGYLFMECIVNHAELRAIWPDALNTIRILFGNCDGNPVVMRSFMRFGNSKSKGVDNASSGGIEAVVNVHTGESFYAFKKNEKGYAEPITNHPDSGAKLLFKIPKWDEVIAELKKICLSYPQLSYLGFDIAVTDDGFKIIEINSLSGLEYVQAKAPMYSDPETRELLRKFGLKR